MFKNHMNHNNSYHIESDLFENHMNRNNSYHIESEQV